MVYENKDKLKIGVAGAGSMGKNHIRIVSELNTLYDFVGIYDPNPEKLSIAEKYGVKFFDTYEQMLDEVDAAIIASPSSMHYQMALKAAEYNVNVLIEKPIAETVEQANEMLQVFKKKELLIGVSYVERYSPVIKALQEVLKDEDILAVEVHRCSPYDCRIFDVDVISDLMIHDIDIVANAIMDKTPVYIDAVGRKSFTNNFADYAQAYLKFDNGTLAFITSSRSTQDKIRTIAVHTREAYIEADMLNKTLNVKKQTVYSEGEHIAYRQSSLNEQIVVPNQEPLREDIINFGRAVRFGEELIIKPEHIVRSMEILDTVHDVVYKKGL